ncbi:MAG: hypothetical protein FWG74_05315, partial [Planctomycetes bacterium]|nr:hypothetical protein [Planctomycetota bacterium]
CVMELDPKYCDVIRKRWAEYVHGAGCDWEGLTPGEACLAALNAPAVNAARGDFGPAPWARTGDGE